MKGRILNDQMWFASYRSGAVRHVVLERPDLEADLARSFPSASTTGAYLLCGQWSAKSDPMEDGEGKPLCKICETRLRRDLHWYGEIPA